MVNGHIFENVRYCQKEMFTLYNQTSDSDVNIVFVNFSKQNSLVVKAYFTPALGS